MRKVYRTRTFTRWMRKSGLTDALLCNAVDEMATGLIDADLGGNVVKKRIALPGKGKRGGARTIVATRLEERWFFLFGFTKAERTTVQKTELKIFQQVGSGLLASSDKQLKQALLLGEIFEVDDSGAET